MDSLSTENRESAIALLDENEAAHRYEDIPISSEQEKSTRPEHAKLESKSLDDVLENIEIPEIEEDDTKNEKDSVNYGYHPIIDFFGNFRFDTAA